DTMQSLVNDLLSGSVDVIQNPPVEQLAQITGAGLKVDTHPSLVLFYENINVTLPPFDVKEVRQAANFALDKDAITAVAQGTGKPLYGAWVDGGYAHWTPDDPYVFNPKRAGELLDAAGWTL